MAGITVRSGVMTFDESAQADGKRETPLRVLVLGNFAGSSTAREPLLSRKHLKLDKDTFDDIFSRLKVTVDLPFAADPIEFNNYDDLHPDHLYENIGLFSRYQTLKKQLRSPDQFAGALATLREEGLVTDSANTSTATSTSAPESTPVQASGLLESLLSGGAPATPSANMIDQLIRQTIAPYLQPQQHPKTEEYLQAVDQAANQVMRQIMHTGVFQKLEASWRSLDLLQRRLDLDRSCHVSLLNVSRAELLTDSTQAKGDLSQSDLLKNVSGIRAKGSPGYDVVVLDPIIDGREDDLAVMTLAMDLAEQTGAVLIASATAALAGYKDFSLAVEQPLSPDLAERWDRLRSHQCAGRTYVAGPRFLVRLPYGKKTALTDRFFYEELPEQGAHAYYLWGNGAYLLLLAMLEGSAKNSEGVGGVAITDMPLHAYLDDDGDSTLKPCAEFYLTESAVNKLECAGFTALQSIQNTNSILIARWKVLQSAPEEI